MSRSMRPSMRPQGPRHKGTGLLPIVQALKSHPAARARVPPELCHYLDTPILASGWYPEDDYHALLQLLAGLVPPEMTGGEEAWAFFGKVAAQRDIAGNQDSVDADSRTPVAGVYKDFADTGKDGVVGLFLRARKLWSLYHDTGQYSLTRSHDDPHSVIIRLTEFRFPARGIVELQMAYVLEFARLVGHPLEGRIRRASSADGGLYEWEYRCAPTDENAASLARLPVDDSANARVRGSGEYRPPPESLAEPDQGEVLPRGCALGNSP